MLDASQRIERGEPIPTTLTPIFDAGSALGGARPKASVRDNDNTLWLAKFPGIQDSILIPEIEAATLHMARHCGMRVPATKVVEIGKQPVMLIKRFDRYWAGTKAIDQAALAMRHIDDVASPALKKTYCEQRLKA